MPLSTPIPAAAAALEVRAASPDDWKRLPPLLRSGVPRHLRSRRVASMRRAPCCDPLVQPGCSADDGFSLRAAMPPLRRGARLSEAASAVDAAIREASAATPTTAPPQNPATRAPTPANAATAPVADPPAAVYLLMHRDQPRFKLGWSFDPLRRAQALPEHADGALNLEASLVVWLPTRGRAEEVERSMHKLLRPSAVPAGHEGDGCTEWFHARAFERAVQLLQRVSLDANRLAAVQALRDVGPGAPAPNLTGAGAEPTWLHLEDLLLRLVQHVPIELQADPAPRLRLVGLRTAWSLPPMAIPPAEPALVELLALRPLVMNAETWQFRRQGRLHSFVQWLDYDRADVVVQFMPLDRMADWDCELHLPTQVDALLQRLVLLSARHPVPAAGAASAPAG